MTDSKTSRRRHPAQLIFMLLNPVVKLILRSPLHRPLSRQILLLSFRGRKTGREYTTPVGYARVDGDTLLFGTGDPWWKNLRGGARVKVRLQGRERAGVADVITDEEGLAESYRKIFTLAPGYARAWQRQGYVSFGPDGSVDREEVSRARRAGHVVVRIRLE